MKKLHAWLMTALLMGTIVASAAFAAETVSATGGGVEDATYKTIALGASAALAIAISVVGAAYAVGKIGSAALGAAAEKPELLIKSLLFVALAEGLAVLGFAISMMLIQKM